MQFNLAATAFYCASYVGPDGRSERRLVVLSPVVLASYRERTTVTWGCSAGKSCLQPDCRYSAAFHAHEGKVMGDG